MSWYCACGLKNSGLNQSCSARLTWNYREHYQVSTNTLDLLRIRFEKPQMTPNEELFKDYYNKGKILVASMNDTELREHREQLSKIATEAKAQLVAADDEIRERSAKKRVKDKEWLVTTDTDLATTDKLNKTVEGRKQRMSKLDKLREQALAAGIDEETVNEMVRNLEKKATEKQVNTITFQKASTETAVVQVPVSKPKPENGDSKPFDPTKLSFGS